MIELKSSDVLREQFYSIFHNYVNLILPPSLLLPEEYTVEDGVDIEYYEEEALGS